MNVNPGNAQAKVCDSLPSESFQPHCPRSESCTVTGVCHAFVEELLPVVLPPQKLVQAFQVVEERWPTWHKKQQNNLSSFKTPGFELGFRRFHLAQAVA